MKLLYSKFCLQSSIGLGGVFLFIYIGAICCVCLLDMSLGIKVAFIIWILFSMLVVTKRYVLLNSANAIVEFGQVLHVGKIAWYLKRRSGAIILASLDYPLYIANYLIIINFILKIKQPRIVLIVSKDAVIADDFRKIKVLLKTYKEQITS